ncbi:MAG: ABC transporter permease subunit [Deltaproteobacteria bacterium]|nr:ABC transporter permease subunit [Deltaproteobacteria bacterium]
MGVDRTRIAAPGSWDYRTAELSPAGAESVAGGAKRAVRYGYEPYLLAAGLLALWHLAASFLPQGGNPLLPAPTVTGKALWTSMPELLKGTYYSFLILVPGYLAAVGAGIAIGLLVGTTGWLDRAFTPFARVASPIPPTVYIPYAIAVLPTFRLSAIFVVFIGAFWPVFLSAAAGAASLEGRYRDNARILGIGGIEYLRKIVFPGALPHIFSGMAVGLALSFILLTVAELFGANAGLGRFVQYYADFADYPRMVAGILYTGVVTFLAMGALDRVKRRALFWVR